MKKRNTEPDFNESLPFSDEAEKGLLSCALHSPESVIPELASQPIEIFYHPANRLLMQEMILMHRDNVPIALDTLTIRLMDKKSLDAVGGPSMTAEIYGFCPTTAHFPYYLNIAKDKLTLRQVSNFCDDIKKQCYEYQEDTQRLLQELNTKARLCVELNCRKPRVTWDQEIDGFEKSFAERLDKDAPQISALHSRLDLWNKWFGGITREFHIFKGKTSRGKTTLALNMLEEVAINHNLPAIWFPYEMKTQSIISRLISSMSGVNLNKILKPDIFRPNRGEVRDIAIATGKIRDAKIRIIKERHMSYELIEQKCDEFTAEVGKIGIIGVDYLQKMPLPSTLSPNTPPLERITENSRLLFDLQQDLDSTMIVISSMNKEGGTYGAQGADYDTDIAVTVDRFEGGKIDKNRNGGGVGEKLDFYFNETCVRFENQIFGNDIPD